MAREGERERAELDYEVGCLGRADLAGYSTSCPVFVFDGSKLGGPRRGICLNRVSLAVANREIETNQSR
jgi:hypothetical protein